MLIKVDLTDLNTPIQKTAMLKMLRILADADDDYTYYKNGVGFNREDSELGHELSELDTLSASEGEAAKAILRKYWRQLPEDLYQIVYGKRKIQSNINIDTNEQTVNYLLNEDSDEPESNNERKRK